MELLKWEQMEWKIENSLRNLDYQQFYKLNYLSKWNVEKQFCCLLNHLEHTQFLIKINHLSLSVLIYRQSCIRDGNLNSREKVTQNLEEQECIE